MGSITNVLSSGSGDGSASGSSTDTITDQIAEAVGGLRASAPQSVPGNLS